MKKIVLLLAISYSAIIVSADKAKKTDSASSSDAKYIEINGSAVKVGKTSYYNDGITASITDKKSGRQYILIQEGDNNRFSVFSHDNTLSWKLVKDLDHGVRKLTNGNIDSEIKARLIAATEEFRRLERLK